MYCVSRSQEPLIDDYINRRFKWRNSVTWSGAAPKPAMVSHNPNSFAFHFAVHVSTRVIYELGSASLSISGQVMVLNSLFLSFSPSASMTTVGSGQDPPPKKRDGWQWNTVETKHIASECVWTGFNHTCIIRVQAHVVRHVAICVFKLIIFRLRKLFILFKNLTFPFPE